MVIFLFTLSAIGLALLIACIYAIISPFIGWHCKFDSSIAKVTMNIPKSGRYSVNIRRDRFWLWKQYGTISDIFPRVNFSIQKEATNKNVPYYSRTSLMTSKSTGRVTVPVGYFDVTHPGKYSISTLPESNFLEKDEVLIRKHIVFVKFFLLIWGIVLSSLMFLLGLIFGILMLTGVFG